MLVVKRGKLPRTCLEPQDKFVPSLRAYMVLYFTQTQTVFKCYISQVYTYIVVVFFRILVFLCGPTRQRELLWSAAQVMTMLNGFGKDRNKTRDTRHKSQTVMIDYFHVTSTWTTLTHLHVCVVFWISRSTWHENKLIRLFRTNHSTLSNTQKRRYILYLFYIISVTPGKSCTYLWPHNAS